MIYGIGNDLVELERFARSLTNKKFLAFCFSSDELNCFAARPVQLAGCFAAKEALSKALGTGVRGFSMNEISVLRNEQGKPYVVLTGKIEQVIREKGLRAHLALTNSERYVIANVVLEVIHETDHVNRAADD